VWFNTEISQGISGILVLKILFTVSKRCSNGEASGLFLMSLYLEILP
jgi:hypothetical protein